MVERNEVKQRNDGDGGFDARRILGAIVRAQVVCPARPLSTEP
jgi:hypothetical protein